MYLTLIGLVLVLFRFLLPDSKSLFFLIWNLCLALIPLILSTSIVFSVTSSKNKFLKVVLGALCLLFLPNAPYILTDFLHILGGNSNFVFFDIFIWFYFSSVAFWIALLSMADISFIFSKNGNNHFLVHFLMLLICFLCGYGIYLGRDLRLNSWDIISNPHSLTQSVVQTFTNKTPGFFNWRAVCFYSVVLYLGFFIRSYSFKIKFLNE